MLTAVYVAVACALSWTKLMWLDELITLHIARLNSLGAIWSALAKGADPNPPLIHILVMLCRRAFGENDLGLRVPAIVGYWVGMLATFAFLKRRSAASWALVGTLLVMDMGAFNWAYESRSYALFYGLAMAAVYCWARMEDRRAQGRPSSGWLAAMAICLVVGICTNYFAVLAFVPVAAAELVTAITRWRTQSGGVRDKLRTVDWPFWAAMVAALAPLLAFRPLIQRSIAVFEPHAWNKVSFDKVTDSYSDMIDFLTMPVLGLMTFAFIVWWLSRFCRSSLAEIRPRWLGHLAAEQRNLKIVPVNLSLPELTTVMVLMAYPFLGYLLALAGGGMLSPRFVIPVCFGFGIAGMIACARVFGHLRSAATAALLLTLAIFLGRQAYIGYWYEEQKQSFWKVVDRIPKAEYPGQPILIGDNLLVLPFMRYAPAELRARGVVPVDFPAIQLGRGEDSTDENLWAGRGSIYKFPLVPMADFVRGADRFVIITGERDWLIGDLSRHRYPVRLLPINTRAGSLAFWATPLSHGAPSIWISGGDRWVAETQAKWWTPLPFDERRNLPSGKLTFDEGGGFGGE